MQITIQNSIPFLIMFMTAQSSFEFIIMMICDMN